jgi:WD40 repeat protein
LGNYETSVLVDIENKQVYRSERFAMHQPVLTPDERYIVYLSEDYDTGGPHHYIAILDAAEDTIKGDFPTIGHMDAHHEMTGPALSPDGTKVAAGRTDSIVYLWELETQKLLFTLKGHASGVTAVAFRPDGRVLASGSQDGLVHLWDVSSGRLERVINGFPNDIESLRFSDSGDTLWVKVSRMDGIFRKDLWYEGPPVFLKETAELHPYREKLYEEGHFEKWGGWGNPKIRFSPDGTWVAVGSHAVQIFDAKKMNVIRVLPVQGNGRVTEIQISPNGRFIGIIDSQGRVQVLDASGGPPLILEGMNVRSIAFSPDSTKIAYGDQNTYIVQTIADKSKVQKKVTLEDWEVSNLQFSKDGRFLYVVLDRTSAVQVWDIQRQVMVKEIAVGGYSSKGHGSRIADFSWPFLAYSDDAMVLWNLSTAQEFILPLPAGSDPFYILFTSRNGELLLGSSGSDLSVWDTKTRTLIYTLEMDQTIYQCDFSPDLKKLAIAMNDRIEIRTITKLLQAPRLAPSPAAATNEMTPTPSENDETGHSPEAAGTSQSSQGETGEDHDAGLELPQLSSKAINSGNAGEVIEKHNIQRGKVEQAAWSSDSRMILIAGPKGVFEYDARTLNLMKHRESDSWITSVASPDPAVIRAAGLEGDQVQLWDAVTGEVINVSTGLGKPAISANGNVILFQDLSYRLMVWRKDTQPEESGYIELVTNRYDHPDQFALSGDGQYAAVNFRSHIRVYDTRSGAVVNAVSSSGLPIHAFSFSSDTRYLIASIGGSAIVLDLRPGFPPTKIQLHPEMITDEPYVLPPDEYQVTAAAIHPALHLAAVGTDERLVQLINMDTGEVQQSLTGHAAPLEGLAFSPDGTQLLSVDRDGMIMIWLMPDGKLVGKLQNHAASINGLIFEERDRFAAWSHNTIWDISATTGRILNTTRIPHGKIFALSPHTNRAAVYHPPHMELWDTLFIEQVRQLDAAKETAIRFYPIRAFYDAAFNSDGSMLAAGGSGGSWIYDAITGDTIHYEDELYLNYSISFHPSTMEILYRSNLELIVKDLKNGERIPILDYDDCYQGEVQTFFVLNGVQIITLNYGCWRFPGSVRLYDIQTEEWITIYTTSKQRLSSIDIRPDLNLIAVGREDGFILLFDATTHVILHELHGHTGSVASLLFSLDGAHLLSGGIDGTIRVWSLP